MKKERDITKEKIMAWIKGIDHERALNHGKKHRFSNSPLGKSLLKVIKK